MMTAADFRTYHSRGRDVIECISPRAEAFFATFCRDHAPCPLKDEAPGGLTSERRFISGFNGGGDFVVKALRAAEAEGLVDEADV